MKPLPKNGGELFPPFKQPTNVNLTSTQYSLLKQWRHDDFCSQSRQIPDGGILAGPLAKHGCEHFRLHDFHKLSDVLILQLV